MDARPRASRRQGAELAAAAQARRRRRDRRPEGAVLRAHVRDSRQGSPARRRLALRGQVGRVSRDLVRDRERSDDAEPQGQRLHREVRACREGDRQGDEDAGLRHRRGGLRSRRGRALELLRDAATEAVDSARLLRLRPARGRGQAARRLTDRGAAGSARGASGQALPHGPHLRVLRRRRTRS